MAKAGRQRLSRTADSPPEHLNGTRRKAVFDRFAGEGIINRPARHEGNEIADSRVNQEGENGQAIKQSVSAHQAPEQADGRNRRGGG